jgi:hypothetical protein
MIEPIIDAMQGTRLFVLEPQRQPCERVQKKGSNGGRLRNVRELKSY